MPDQKPKPAEQSVIWHQSGINLNGEPFVQLLKNDQIIGQMTPEEARQHAHQVLEAAEASEQDAFLFNFARDEMKLEDMDAMRIIVGIRHHRAERTGKSQGPTRPTDWVHPPKEGS